MYQYFKSIRDSIADISEYYGYALQSRQCMEEMGELTQALNKHYKYINAVPFKDLDLESDCRTRVIDEIADVQIMLLQISHLLSADDEVYSVIINKLCCLVDDISKGD